MLDIERQLWIRGYRRLAGVDEAGRGTLAGPVVAAAVVFSRRCLEQEEHGLFDGLNDSKQLSERERRRFYSLLVSYPGIEIGIGFGDVSEIDEINILRSTHRAMIRALLNLPAIPDHAIVDGLPVPEMPCASLSVVGGDSKSLSVAAASVVAKVTRDQWMMDLDKLHPEYGFSQNKGYGTAAHFKALLEYGCIEQHRRSFRPVRDIVEIRSRAGATREAVRQGAGWGIGNDLPQKTA